MKMVRSAPAADQEEPYAGKNPTAMDLSLVKTFYILNWFAQNKLWLANILYHTFGYASDVKISDWAKL